MDESVVKHLEKASQTMSLSQAIRVGADLIREERTRYLYDGCGCAIGAALAARGYTHQVQVAVGFDILSSVSNMFGVPQKVLLTASAYHMQGVMNRLQIADWLASQGY